ncbi:PRC-barrel domain-containing protein [Paracoccus benzoatiresistens]|uniref:PRC-barrel domain-containing protein n=1 Tax=Paracoccus benzoatiresistens TaxID=2997341 RepID=A0ABT4JCH2_9RHOB|nr:PRC-barrel domain-containing protein [Paracoccus sp. EF6]MCZ0964272.1 PRC-barrel domain-containing protein [Paracoccus sp. EF6]
MKKLLTSTALMAMLAGPVLAQTTAEPAPATTEAPAADATTTTTAPATTETAPATDADTTAASTEAGFGYMAAPTDMSAETFIDKDLYVTETDPDTSATYNEADEGWDDIGEIEDLVISETGEVKAVLIDIGGFLGIGERTVSVSMDQLRMIRDGDSEDDYFIVFTANRAALENAPEFEWPERD